MILTVLQLLTSLPLTFLVVQTRLVEATFLDAAFFLTVRFLVAACALPIAGRSMVRASPSRTEPPGAVTSPKASSAVSETAFFPFNNAILILN